MAEPLRVSVVVAAHEGGAPLLEAAIASVTGQSYGHVQLLVAAPMQDAELLRVLQRHAHELSHVPWLPPAGAPAPHGAQPYEAFNAGLAQARGDVVVFLGGREGLAASSVLSEVAQHFADPSVDAVYGDLHYVPAYGPAHAPGTPLQRWRAPSLTRAALARGWLTPLGALFVRRVWFERLGGFDARLGPAADFAKVGQLFRQPGFRAVQLPKACCLRWVESAATTGPG